MAGLLGIFAIGSGCIDPDLYSCRAIATTELLLKCENTNEPFAGELHFDSEATYDTFLTHQCIPGSADSPSIIEGHKSQVDFTVDAVFVAVGPSAIDADRCVEDRSLDSAAACTSGLKVFYDDEYIDPQFGCPNDRWTVAFSLSREDLRSALDAADQNDFD